MKHISPFIITLIMTVFLSSCAITGHMDHNKHVKLVKKKTTKQVVKQHNFEKNEAVALVKVKETEKLQKATVQQINNYNNTYELTQNKLPVNVTTTAIELLVEKQEPTFVVSNNEALTIELSNIADIKVKKAERLLKKVDKKVNKIVSKSNPAFKSEVIKAIETSEIETASISNEVEVLDAAVISKAMDMPDESDKTLLYLLAFFIPFVAVGMVTDWEIKDILINLLLTALCGIPGIIHAFIKVKNYYDGRG